MKYIKIDGIEYEILPHFQRIKKIFFGNPVMNYLLPRRMMLYLLEASGSPLFKESLERPGGWRAMEIMYENKRPRSFFDRMAIRYGVFSMAIRNRKKLVKRFLHRAFDRHSREERLIIVSVGSGPGTHVIDAMADHHHKGVHAYCIDFDGAAFEFGEKHTREHGLAHRVNYIEGDARDLHQHVSVVPHIVKMIGLLEYLSDDECIEMFRAMNDALAPGGNLITSGLIDRHKQSRFLSRILNWRLNFRTADDVIRLLKAASFTNFEVSMEPMGIFPVILAEKK